MTAQERRLASEPSSPPASAGVFAPGHRRLTAGILTTVLVIAFEAMGVATAMPVIVPALDGLSYYAWGFSAFLTTSLVGVVVAGDLSDRHGPRGPFLASGLLFAAGLLVAGLAPDMGVFVAGRALQGFGAGMLIVALYVVVGRAYSDAVRPRAFAVMSAGWVLPSIVGPTVAGWLADALTWRLVFLGVLPFLVPALSLILPRLRDMSGSSGDRPPTARPRIGLALAAAVGAATLQYAGQRLDRIGLLLLLLALGLLIPSVPRLLPRGTLTAARGLPTSVLLRGVLAGSFFGAEAFFPLMLVEHRGLPTTLAGLSLTGAALGWSVGSWYQGRPGNRTSRARLVQIGCVLVALSIGVAAIAVSPAVPAYLAGIGWAVGGLGMGLGMTTVSVVVLQLSPPGAQGANSAALQLSDALGSVVCIGLGGTLFASLHERAGVGALVFLGIYTVMAAVAVLGAVLAPRVRPTSEAAG